MPRGRRRLPTSNRARAARAARGANQRAGQWSEQGEGWRVEKKEKEKEGQRAWPSAWRGAGLTVGNAEPSSLVNPRLEAGLRESSAVVIPRLGTGCSQSPPPVMTVASLRFL
jgi:hypothetical protein